MRRANGTGTITKLSGNRRKPYIAKFCTGKGIDNKRRYTIVGYYATKKEADIALAQFSLNPDPMSVSNFTFADAWNIVRDNFLPTKADETIRAYDVAFSRCSSIHNSPLRNLKTVNYQQVIDGCDCQGRSARMHIKTVMVKVCDYALQNDICLKNYAKFVVVNGTTQPKKEIYTDNEISAFFLDGSAPAKELLMLIFSGFRIGEFAVIRKQDVDLDKRIVIGGSKTKAGKNRIVPIHEKVYPFWKEYYSNADEYLFPSTSGGARLKGAWYLRFKALHEKLGIPFRSPHTARHTCASIMARDGMNPLYIKEILGHATYSFTADRYTHVDVDALVKEIGKIK